MSDTSAATEQLQRLRARIDHLDAALLYLLSERFALTHEVGVLKSEAGMPPADKSREAYQIARLRSLAEETGLDPEFAQDFLNLVIRHVIRHHEAIREGGSGA